MKMAPGVDAIVAEWQRNVRLRRGVWIVIGIVWLAGLLELRDQIDRRWGEHRALSLKVARVKSLSSQDEWVARRDEALAAGLVWDRRLWSESTIGLAQASFADWLRQVASRSALQTAQVTVLSAAEAPADARPARVAQGERGSVADLWKVGAQLTFDFSPRTFYPFLGQLVSSERRVVIESLVIRTTPSPRAELRVAAYFQQPAPAVAPPSPGKSAP